MNDKICPICKFYGHLTHGNHRDTIYQDRGEVVIHLCYYHSVVFFKSGQTSFIAKYREVFTGYDLLAQPTISGRKVSSLFGF